MNDVVTFREARAVATRRIEGEPPSGVERDGRSVVELAGVRLVVCCCAHVGQDGLVDVHDDLVAIRAIGYAKLAALDRASLGRVDDF